MTQQNPLANLLKTIFWSRKYLVLKVLVPIILGCWYIEYYIAPFPFTMTDTHMNDYFEHKGFDKGVIRKLPEYIELNDFILRHKKSLFDYRKVQNKGFKKGSMVLRSLKAEDTTNILGFVAENNLFKAGDFSIENNWKKYKYQYMKSIWQDPYDIASLPDSLGWPLARIWRKIGDGYIDGISLNIDSGYAMINIPPDYFNGSRWGDLYFFEQWLELHNNKIYPANYEKDSAEFNGWKRKELPDGWDYIIAWYKSVKY